MPVALCVLGCASASAALARRARTAADVFRAYSPDVIVACGGKAWSGVLEADALLTLLVQAGVPPERTIAERTSSDTYENAREAAQILQGRSIREVVIVTCSWHVPRAARLFERAGLDVVEAIGAEPPSPTRRQRLWWLARERVSWWKDRLR